MIVVTRCRRAGGVGEVVGHDVGPLKEGLMAAQTLALSSAENVAGNILQSVIDNRGLKPDTEQKKWASAKIAERFAKIYGEFVDGHGPEGAWNQAMESAKSQAGWEADFF
ncbi:hypothetical protein [Actinomadura sp. B10D3]|uniref:hypothetical protein n=1 Tax=Actinomadura sp. B10D3 TaxID=3153557 RepID=UPI00325D0EC6